MKSCWLIKLLHPQGKAGVAVSLFMALLVLLTANLASYKYLQNEPPNVAMKDTKWGWAFRPVTGFAGIRTLSEPVDTLLLGDSTCNVNLIAGPFTDRLGGSTINLGNINESSFLNDAWMLGYYVKLFGPPRNVIVSRSSPWGYDRQHNIEFMSAIPLPWGFWNQFGVVPDWKPGDISNLFITKFGVLYSDSDILKDRFVNIWKLFRYPIIPIQPSREYLRGSVDPQGPFNVLNHLPDFYFDKFSLTKDTTTALRYMSNLVREKSFQLYFAFQPEWDGALQDDVRKEILNVQQEYLSQFTDKTYVHILRDPQLAFPSTQMESPNHLYPGADRIFTEANVDMIVNLQNQFTYYQAQPLELNSIKLDKDHYLLRDTPNITLEVNNHGTKEISGGVSLLVRPAASQDRNWIVRAPAIAMNLPTGGTLKLNLAITAGKINKTGNYNLVVFLRQNVGTLSHETRIEIDNLLTVIDSR